jgi:hypothetical protein
MKKNQKPLKVGQIVPKKMRPTGGGYDTMSEEEWHVARIDWNYHSPRKVFADYLNKSAVSLGSINGPLSKICADAEQREQAEKAIAKIKDWSRKMRLREARQVYTGYIRWLSLPKSQRQEFLAANKAGEYISPY